MIPKAKLPRIIQSVLRCVSSSCTLVCACRTLFLYSSILSPDVETSANNLILVGHGVHMDIQRLEEMKISTYPSSPSFPHHIRSVSDTKMTCTELPHNVLVIDTTALERTLSGAPPQVQGQQPSKKHTPRPSLAALLCALGVQPACLLNNAGNDAFMGLYAFQRMIDPESAALPVPAAVPTSTAARMSSAHMGVPAVPVHPALSPRISGMPGMGGMGMGMYAPAQYLPVSAHGVGTVRGAGLSPHMNSVYSANANGVHSGNGVSDMGTLNSRIPSMLGPVSPLMLPVADITSGKGEGGSIRDRDGGRGVDELGRRGAGKGAGTGARRDRVSVSSSGSGSGTQTSTSTSTSTSADTGTSNTNTNSNGTGTNTGMGGKSGLRKVAMALQAVAK